MRLGFENDDPRSVSAVGWNGANQQACGRHNTRRWFAEAAWRVSPIDTVRRPAERRAAGSYVPEYAPTHQI